MNTIINYIKYHIYTYGNKPEVIDKILNALEKGIQIFWDDEENGVIIICEDWWDAVVAKYSLHTCNNILGNIMGVKYMRLVNKNEIQFLRGMYLTDIINK